MAISISPSRTRASRTACTRTPGVRCRWRGLRRRPTRPTRSRGGTGTGTAISTWRSGTIRARRTTSTRTPAETSCWRGRPGRPTGPGTWPGATGTATATSTSPSPSTAATRSTRTSGSASSLSGPPTSGRTPRASRGATGTATGISTSPRAPRTSPRPRCGCTRTPVGRCTWPGRLPITTIRRTASPGATGTATAISTSPWATKVRTGSSTTRAEP